MRIISRLILVWALSLLCFAPCLHAAAPGLPFTEDFATDDLEDSPETSANWVTDAVPANAKLILAWRKAMFGPFGPAPGADIPGAGATSAVAVGDVDGDGNMDVVAGNFGTANMLYLGDGGGGFAAGTPITADAHNTTCIALGDMDRDGDLDVVVGNSFTNNRLYLNDGDGDPFDTVTGSDIGTTGYDTRAIAVGYVDADEYLDVVEGNVSPVGAINQLYLNNGTATPFSGVTGAAIGAADNTLAIALADVDGDGDIDVVAATDVGDTNKAYLNNGTAAPFSAVTADVIGGVDMTQAIALADVDGDGDIDVVAGTSGANTNKVYLNDGTADPFNGVAAAAIGAADNTQAIALADIDADGDMDVIAGTAAAVTNKLYVNNGTADPFNGVSAAAIGVGAADEEDTKGVALGDMDGDGTLDLVAGNDGTANHLYLNPANYDPFNGVAGSDAAVDTDATAAVALGDVDGDGDLDLVAGNAGQINLLYPGNGDGTFAVGKNIDAADSDQTYAITLGDVNNDGHLDVVAGNFFAANRMYLNNGTNDPFNAVTGSDIGYVTDGGTASGGTLSTLEDTDSGKSWTVDEWIGATVDITVGTGSPDSSTVTSNTANILTVNPDWGIAPDGTSVYTVTISADTDNTAAIALRDVDEDGNLDIVAGNNGSANRIYLGNGDGTFAGGADIETGEADDTSAIALGDLDNNGTLDIVAGNSLTGPDQIYLGNGDGTFLGGANIEAGESDATAELALGDVDGDGNLDVIAGNFSAINKVYLGAGDGTFAAGADITADADGSYAIVLHDMDGDGDLDVVVGNDVGGAGEINRLYLGNGDGTFAAGTDITTDSDATYGIALGDVDNDGDTDIAAGNLNAVPNRVYLNARGTLGSAGMATVSDFPIDAYNTTAIAIGDVDGDGDPNIVVGNDGQTNTLYVKPVNVDIGTETDSTRAVAIADVNGDGYLDVVTGNNGQINRLYLNNKSATPFTPAAAGDDIGDFATEATDNTEAIAIADMDGDGDLDVVVGNNGQANKLYVNDGTADPFNGVAGVDIGTDIDDTWAIALGDVNGDGHIDVVAGNFNAENKLYLNDGDSVPFDSLGAGDNIGTDTDGTNAIALADVDGDGDLDVVAGNWGGTVKLYLNDGDAAPFDSVGVGANVGTDADNTWDIALSDVDGDGDIDVVAGNWGVTNKLYLNDGDAAPFDSLGAGANIGTDTDNTYAIAVFDDHVDGSLDILAGNSSAAANRLYRRRTYDTTAGKGVSIEVDTETVDITNALVTVIPAPQVNLNTWADMYISNDGGAQWFQITSGTVFVFPVAVTGADLRWKAELHSLSPYLSPEVTQIDIVYDDTPPTAGTVNDGAAADIDEQSDLDFIRANWSGFADVGTGIASYEWAIWTDGVGSAGAPDIQAWTDVGNVTTAINATLLGTLAAGPLYRVSVRAIDYAGNQGAIGTSDGVTIVLGVEFDAATSSGLESVTSVLLPVSLSAVATGPITVDYAIAAAGGTAVGGGVDYLLPAGTITFDIGDQTKNISLIIINELNFELDETIVVELSNPTNATLEATDTHTYTITNEDPPPNIHFAVSTSTGMESAEEDATIAVSLSGTTIYDVTVDYKVTGGSATTGADYTLDDGILTIASGQLSGDISIAVVDDIWGEPDETVEITISNSNNAILSAPSVHTFKITHAGHRVTFTSGGGGGGCFLSR